jgi:hypothetical protein
MANKKAEWGEAGQPAEGGPMENEMPEPHVAKRKRSRKSGQDRRTKSKRI